MLFIPDYEECYLDTVNYGAFRLYLPTSGMATATAAKFFTYRNLCYQNSSGAAATNITAGQVFDATHQCDNHVTVFINGGTENKPAGNYTPASLFKRRVIVYTQKVLT